MMETVCRRSTIRYGRPKVMGILNVTPDSFSDGGRYSGSSAVAHAMELVDAGADIIDIGGESTRPGSSSVPVDVELSRVIPVLKDLIPSIDVPVSVDTMKTDVAAAAIDAGADIINDVNGLRSPGMLELVAAADVPVVIMHMKGTPADMQTDPLGAGDIQTVVDFLRERETAALDAGVRQIIMDPGVGFGKTADLNMLMIDSARCFSLDRYPVLIGASRKGFLAKLFPGTDREEASVMVAKRAVSSGADIVRVHDVGRTVAALKRKI
jgi:dihydropteroate synthase